MTADRWPGPPTALRERMAAVYGVEPAQVLPTRGATHALELVMRLVSLDGYRSVVAQRTPLTERLARITRLTLLDAAASGTGAVVLASPAEPLGEVLAAGEIRALAEKASPALLVVDESTVEYADRPSLAALTGEISNLVVLRSLSFAYGLPGARCGAAIARPDLIAWLEEVMEPSPMPQPTIQAAEAALSPSRALMIRARIAQARAELCGQPASLVQTAITELGDADYRELLYSRAGICDRLLLCWRSVRREGLALASGAWVVA